MNYFELVPDNVSPPQSLLSYLSSSSPSALTGMVRQSKLFLMDLPGFGYDSAPDTNIDKWQDRRQWFLISGSKAATPLADNAMGKATLEAAAAVDDGNNRDCPP